MKSVVKLLVTNLKRNFLEKINTKIATKNAPQFSHPNSQSFITLIFWDRSHVTVLQARLRERKLHFAGDLPGDCLGAAFYKEFEHGPLETQENRNFVQVLLVNLLVFSMPLVQHIVRCLCGDHQLGDGACDSVVFTEVPLRGAQPHKPDTSV